MSNKKITLKDLKAHFDRHNATAACNSNKAFGHVVAGKGGSTTNYAIPDSIFDRKLDEKMAKEEAKKRCGIRN